MINMILYHDLEIPLFDHVYFVKTEQYRHSFRVDYHEWLEMHASLAGWGYGPLVRRVVTPKGVIRRVIAPNRA